LTEVTTTAWIVFIAVVAALLILDIGVLNRRAHVIKPKEAMLQVSLFIGVAVAFNLGIYYFMGTQTGLEFTTGYILELMLSVDNLFVFVLIFTSFCVPEEDQHKVLFYGIMGALVFRMIFIFAGVALVETFDWILYVFGAFLVYTGLKMAFKSDEKPVHPDQNAIGEVLPEDPAGHQGLRGRQVLRPTSRHRQEGGQDGSCGPPPCSSL